MALHYLRAILEQKRRPLAGERNVAQIVRLHLDLAHRADDAVHAGLQHGLKAAVDDQQRTLLVANYDALERQ